MSTNHHYERGSICSSIGGDAFATAPRKFGDYSSQVRGHSIDSIVEQQLPKKVLNRFNSSFHSFRFLVVMFGGFSAGIMCFFRYNITVAILNMVNQTTIYLAEHPDKTIEDFENEGYSSTGEFDWDNEIQHVIMSWYMIAYTLPQIPTTKLSLLIGSKYSIPISLSLCAISEMLTPILSYVSWKLVVVLRLVNGIGASAIMPMLLNLVENWMPYNEITLGLTWALLTQCVIIAANPLIAGYLCSIHWKYAFYVPGVATIIFCFIWLILITDHPDENRFVSIKELDLIHSSNNKCTNGEGQKETGTQEKKKKQEKEEPEVEATWIDVFKVPSFYAYLVLWCFYCSPYSVFSFILPTYFRQFLKISVQENGFYCFIIMTGSIFSIMWPHPFMRFLQEKVRLSLTNSRRITLFIICSMLAVTWSYVGTFHSSQLVVLLINRLFHNSTDLVVTSTLMGNFAKAGLSSIAFSMVNTIGNLSIVGFSTFCGYVLDVTGQSVQGWTYIWYGLAGCQLVLFSIFSVFIQAGPISFNQSKKDNSKEEEEVNRKSLSNIVIAPSKVKSNS